MLILELMSMTGLFDKNGKAIFEGDIVKCYTNDLWLKGIVTFVSGTYIIKFAKNNITPVNLLHHIPMSCIKILGNIYENPELLE